MATGFIFSKKRETVPTVESDPNSSGSADRVSRAIHAAKVLKKMIQDTFFE